MANTIKLKRASGSDPSASDLSVGELAIRTSNCKLFSRNDGGSAVGIVAGSADTLTTARTIAGVSFDGSANISLNNNAITNGAGYLANIVSDSSPQLGGNLDVQSSGFTTSTSNGNIKATPDGSGVFEVRSSGSVDGTLQLNCTVNSHGVKLRSPSHSAGQSYTLILPDNQVAADKFLKVKSISGSGSTAIGQLEYADVATDLVDDTSPQLGGDLDVQSNKITTATSNGNVKIEPNGTGVVEVRGAGGNDGKLQLNCSAQSHGIKLASPAHSAGQSYTLIFPDNQIAADKYLKIKSISGSGSTAIGQAEYASLDANDLGEGTVPDARFPSTLPALNGSALTDLNGSNITSGTIAAARVATLNQDTTGSSASCTGNAATATALANARTIAGVSFDGTSNISLNNNAITNGAGYITATLTEEQVEDFVGGMVTGNTETGITVTYQDSDGTLDFVVASQTDNNFTTTLKNKLDGIESGATADQSKSDIDALGIAASTAATLATARNIGGVSFNGSANIDLPGVNSSGNQDTSGNAATATTLETARTIAGVSFDGSANISLNNNAITNGAGYITGSSLNASNLSSGTIPDARFPSTLPAVDGSNLTGISAGATGGGSDEIFYENGQNVTTNYTITNGKNAMSAGPITIDSGVTVTVGAGETLTIV
tara:strand:- start:132 stop:2114 length:1983 start_codon:yes stop_codon:yes gene_type:complete